MKHILVLLILVPLVSNSEVTSTYFGFGDMPFMGKYERTQFSQVTFVDDEYYDGTFLSFLERNYGQGKLFTGMLGLKPVANLKIEDVYSPEGYLGEHLIEFDLWGNNSAKLDLFYWSKEAPVRIIDFTESRLDSEMIQTWRLKLKLVVESEIAKFGTEKRKSLSSFEILPPQIKSVAGKHQIYVIQYPVHFKKEYGEISRIDDRGLGTIIYSKNENRVIKMTFGHGEWSPNVDTILTIKPILFFEIGELSKLYMVSEWSMGWESRLHAIVDVLTAEPILFTFE